MGMNLSASLTSRSEVSAGTRQHLARGVVQAHVPDARTGPLPDHRIEGEGQYVPGVVPQR